jgi:hypothetical protein
MAFSNTNLTQMVETEHLDLWAYTTPDRSQAVGQANYFGPASDVLNVGDFIFLNADVDAELQFGILVVTHVQPNFVKTAKLTR